MTPADVGVPTTAIRVALARAFGQFRDPMFRRIVWRSVALSLVVFVVLAAIVWWFLSNWTTGDGYFGSALKSLGGIFGWLLFVIVTWALFPAVVSQFVSLFLDDVAAAVERRYYPDDPPGRTLGVVQGFTVGIKFTALLVIINLVAMPFYVLSFFIPFLNVVVFYSLNGYLLAHEYFDLVSLRHRDAAGATALRRAFRGKLFFAGVAIAFLLTVPVVNVVAAIVGAAAMTHLFKGLAVRRPGE